MPKTLMPLLNCSVSDGPFSERDNQPPVFVGEIAEDGRDVPSPLVSLLLTHRADVHAADARGKTPLMHVGKAQNDLTVWVSLKIWGKTSISIG